ncbi:MAG: orotate phosphoribosyltransferase [Lachnospiraceae bacterium]|nr:orotate phosphoribosyltransferase [Lachnospiraceae bacterium]
MENSVMKFYSKAGNNIVLRAIPGHFATSHSHINYYVDMTGLKTRRSEAAAVAKAFVQRFPIDTVIDTIVCMDGTEVIGAYLAEELEKGSFPNQNMHQTVYVVTPEFNINNQMLFRDNLVSAIRGKNVILLLATSTTGLTISRSMECIDYYGGNVVHICSVFSAIDSINGKQVESIFTTDDVPGYQAYEAYACPYCKAKQKLDAMVNGYGYSKL